MNSNETKPEKLTEKELPNTKPPKLKPKRRNKTDLGPDFVAPDGGWAWVVCIASGFTSFCVFTPVQQYGIIYRQRMFDLGFDAKQITTIINSELATAALTGIINGALFRRFTYRQAALTGGLLVFLGIFLTAFCKTFWQYFICFSCLYGIGLGMNLSAMALAVNTYFKINRRRATGFSSTITGLGPIMLPHICTFLLQVYGTQGTILLVAAFSLNTLFCGITLQPVRWHVKSKRETLKLDSCTEKFQAVILNQENPKIFVNKCKYCQVQKEVLSNEGLEARTYDINDQETAMLAARAEVAWLGSRSTLNSLEIVSNQNKLKIHRSTADISENNSENPARCTCAEEMALLQKNSENNSKFDEKVKSKLTLKENIIKFFDLDLLTDITFVNLIQGMTVMMFCELNFSFLTPFILGSYGYKNEEISVAMSLLACVDIIVRFTAPFALEKVKLSNNLLFAFGIVILLMGRICVTIVNSYYAILAIFLVMGFGKGFRTIFAPLLIPTYVPLDRLPGASGLQLFLNALFTMAVGPVLGLIADVSSYTFTIHLMNLMTIISLLLWIIEWLVRRILGKSNQMKTES